MSERIGFNVPIITIGHFGDESFQSITCTGTGNLTRTTKRQNTQITRSSTAQKVALVNSTTDTLKNLRYDERGLTELGFVALYDIRP